VLSKNIVFQTFKILKRSLVIFLYTLFVNLTSKVEERSLSYSVIRPEGNFLSPNKKTHFKNQLGKRVPLVILE